ncbi:MAG: TonB-dependent receptor, partial [Cytophagaceae bacterium]|nr:TonB-dependent receptor [Gemmatimonadaceae bacterium]
SQFGGLVNYRTKAADTTRRIAFESISSAGSYGLLGTWNSASGRVGPLTYRAYASGRQSDGYRSSSESRASSQYLGVDYRVNDKVDVRGQVGRSWYRYQIPGALTDAMFDANPRAATRSRNWFSPDIVVPSVAVTWRPNWRTRVHAQLSAVLGNRSSVQFVGFADVRDTVQAATGTYLPRQVDIDGFQSITGEVRVTNEYRLGDLPWILAAGIAINDNDLHRRQQGRGTTGTGYDLTLSSGTFGRDIHYLTNNVAVYAEQLIPVTSRFSVIPGVRIERGETRMRGRLSYLDPAQVPTNIEHNYPLFGIRAEWQVANAEVYGGWSQSYRPMILKDVIPETAIERTDPNLRDARGWTIEGGVRGMLGHVRYDVSAFALRYNNRFGGILQVDSAGASYLFKTNVGSSLTRGIELALDAPLVVMRTGALRAHTATSYFDGTYRRGTVTSAGQNLDITGNRIEAVPKWISRTGLTAGGSATSATLLVSYTSDSYADPQNTLVPSANGARGLVPSYTIVDVNASRQLAPWVRVRVGVSNLFGANYFTKRPTFYPGPGIWPSDGRGVNASVELVR